MGWGHHKTAVIEYAMMLLAGGSALWGIGLDTQAQGYLLVCWGAIYLGLLTWIDRRWRQHEAMSKKCN
jgi:hypothetical protein